jgi:hypothetical protein
MAVNTSPWRELMDVAREHGWTIALSRLHAMAGDGALLVGPAGHAVAPAGLERGAGTVYELGVPDLVGLRIREPGDRTPTEAARWAVALAGLRLGLSHRLLESALAYLGGRRTGEVTLLQHQAVQLAVADVTIAHLEIQGALEAAGPEPVDPVAAADLHGRITGTDRTLLHLFGASGYVLDGPGCTAYVSELLADAYVGPVGQGGVA